LLSQILAHVDYVEEAVEAVGEQIGVLIAPFRDDLERLSTIPGVKRRTAEVIIAEIGVDMRMFPSAGHLASWAALCPGNNESAGSIGPGRPAGAIPGFARLSPRPRWARSATGAEPSPRGIVESCGTGGTRRP
jgi:transposase